MTVEFALLLVGAYLLGSIPTAYLAVRWSRGIDIRQYGSGNVGAANIRKLTSRWIFLAVIIFDIVKGMVMVVVARVIGLEIYQQVAIGLLGIIGHNWPVSLRFSGGRGMLTTLGVAFILPVINGPLVPWETITALVIIAIGAFIVHNVPMGMVVGVAPAPLVSWLTGKPTEMTWGFLAIFLIMVIRRLTAPKTPLAASVSTGELLINRLLFDRDIRDKEAWLQRQPVKPKEKRRRG
jgi:glycerol-3-phosphate acyltransferase PlsY